MMKTETNGDRRSNTMGNNESTRTLGSAGGGSSVVSSAPQVVQTTCSLYKTRDRTNGNVVHLSLREDASEAILIRALRRRFWKAIRDHQDGDWACQLYTATRDDFLNHLLVMEEEQERQKILQQQQLEQQQELERRKQQQLIHQQRPAILKKIMSTKKKAWSSKRNVTGPETTTTTTATNTSLDVAATNGGSNPASGHALKSPPPSAFNMTTNENDSSKGSKLGLLQLHLLPTEPFHRDDYFSPADFYLGTTREEQQQNQQDNGGSAPNVLNEKNGGGKSSLRRPRNQQSSATTNAIPHFLGRQAMSLFQRARSTAAAASGSDFLRSTNDPLEASTTNRAGGGGSGGVVWMSERQRRLLDHHEAAASSRKAGDETETGGDDDENNGGEEDERMTTPLHEAARLGHATLLRLLLAESDNAQGTTKGDHKNVDVNVRNGKEQTPLHMVAGGINLQEAGFIDDTDVDDNSCGNATSTSTLDLGIRAPESILVPLVKKKAPGTGTDATATGSPSSTTAAGRTTNAAKKAARAVGRFFRDSTRSSSSKDMSKTKCTNDHQTTELDKNKKKKKRRNPHDPVWLELVRQRADAAVVLMNYTNSNTGMGCSMNSVDRRQRTALHYAAELGRVEICLALLNSFGTMLTIVDERGRTPCELADHSNTTNWNSKQDGLPSSSSSSNESNISLPFYYNPSLASQLEARALLYIDPYGMDDDMFAAIGVDPSSLHHYERNKNLVPPFSWFETLTVPQAHEERQKRIDKVLERLKKSVQKRHAARNATKNILSAASNAAEHNEESIKKTAAASAATKQREDEEDKKMKGSWKENESEEGDSHAATVQRLKSQSSSDDDDADDYEPDSTDADEDDYKYSAKPKQGKNDDKDKSKKENDEQLEDEQLDILVQDGILHQTYAEQLLSYHRWDTKLAIQTINKNPIKALEEANIGIASSFNARNQNEEEQQICLICSEMFDIKSNEWKKLVGCEHAFCVNCLGDFLSNAAVSRAGGLSVQCPHHKCRVPLSPLEIEELAPTPDVYGSLLETSNENFVVASHDLRFCPHPACTGIVKYTMPNFVKAAGLAHGLLEIVGAVCTAVGHKKNNNESTSVQDTKPQQQAMTLPVTYEGVYDPNYYNALQTEQPLQAHRFCFHCGETKSHWPVTCERLSEWKDVVAEQVKDVADGDNDETDNNYEDVAHRLWMKANTKPCPKCKAPIEKNEGCNHMTCTNPVCLHEFCWICRKDWKLHSTETGGFFRCNRWVDEKDHDYYDKPPADPNAINNLTEEDLSNPTTMNATYGTAMHAARVAFKRSREMDRFLHHYQRWNAHAESAALEQRMATTAVLRLQPVVQAAIEFNGLPDFNFDGKGLSFVHAAFTELLECRSMLQHSYAFSYFRYKMSTVPSFKSMRQRLAEKAAFEQSQSSLETMTEQISDVVARSHLRASQSQITFLTNATANKRKEFSNLMINILVEEYKEKEKEADPIHSQKKARKKKVSRAVAAIGATAEQRAVSSVSGQSTLVIDTDAVRAADSSDENDLARMEEAIRQSLEDMVSSRPVSASSSLTPAVGVSWECAACTFVNSGGSRCAMCNTQRP